MPPPHRTGHNSSHFTMATSVCGFFRLHSTIYLWDRKQFHWVTPMFLLGILALSLQNDYKISCLSRENCATNNRIIYLQNHKFLLWSSWDKPPSWNLYLTIIVCCGSELRILGIHLVDNLCRFTIISGNCLISLEHVTGELLLITF